MFSGLGGQATPGWRLGSMRALQEKEDPSMFAR